MRLSFSFSLLFLFILSNGFTNKDKARHSGVHSKLDSVANTVGVKFISDPAHVGLAIGIYNHGETLTYNFGTTEKGKQIKPTAGSIFEIGSVTKSFMGLLLARAVTDKKLKLDDDVTKYLGNRYKNLTLNGHTVKIRDLATHTAGLGKNIPDLTNLPLTEINKTFAKYSEQDFLNDLAKVTPATTPGTTFRYSNAGTQAAEIIVEKIYHQKFAALVKQFITWPAGMRQTVTTVNANDEPEYVQGYGADGLPAPRPGLWKVLPAAGDLKSTVNDMLKYIRWNINEDGNKTVGLAHIPLFAHTDEDDADIGFFWFVKNNTAGEREIMHAGGTFGTTSFLLINPGKSSRKVRIISLPVLSHHRTCRSAYGGSLNINSSRSYDVF